MAQIHFFSDLTSSKLYPLNIGRCASSLHFGVRSVAQQWIEALSNMVEFDLEINSRLFPTLQAIDTLKNLKPGETLEIDGEVIAKRTGANCFNNNLDANPDIILANSAADYFENCGAGIEADLERIKLAWRTRTLEEEERDAWFRIGVIVHGDMNRIHVSPGAKIRSCTINTECGDVILGTDTEVMEGSNIRGPFALGEKSQIRMGSQLYGATSIGKNCKVGGELSNVVIHDYSNKAHGGFLGNSVLGSWCNLGAETATSNLKNTYGKVSIWDDVKKELVLSDRVFCGLLMGDHSKTAINTAFNTATVVGAFCNVFGAGTPPKHIPSFSWGGAEGFKEYKLDQAISTANRVMARRRLKLDSTQKTAIAKLHKDSEANRLRSGLFDNFN